MLLRASRPAPAAAENTAFLSGGQIKLSDDQRRALVDMLTDAVDNVSANSNLLVGLMEVLPDIEHVAPDRADKVKAKLSTRVLTKEQSGGWQFDSLFGQG